MRGVDSRRTGRASRTVRTLGLLLGLVILSPLLFFWGALAWIASWPLPPVPRSAAPSFSVTEVPGESLPEDYFSPHQASRQPSSLGWDLTDEGRVERVDEAERGRREGAREAAAERAARALKDARVAPPPQVLAVAPDGDAVLVWHDVALRLFRSGKPVATRRPGVRGYAWKGIYFTSFHALNDAGVAVGNARIATAMASSGGTSSPHGRWMPLLWDGSDGAQPTDMNSLIDPARGWYLDLALAVNGRGQVLCFGRRTDARGAEETAPREAYRLLLLTPTRLTPTR